MDGRGPYGLACKVCYKAKARCTRTENSAGCERCWRLGKDCVPSDSLRRRNLITYQSSQLENLEGRLDELTILIENMQAQQQAPTMMFPSFASAFPPNHALPPPETILLSAPIEVPTPQEPSKTPRPQEQSTDVPYTDTTWPSRPGEEVLKLFRSRFLPHTPFFFVPEDANVEDLKTRKPIVWQAIYAVTARWIPEKIALGKEFKVTIATKIVVENESSTELIMAILIYTAWSHDQHVNRDWTLSRLMELALSVVHALRLQAPEPLGAHRFTELGGQHYWPGPKDADQRSLEYLEDERAVMGCFLLTSFISIFFAEIAPMPWTDLMQEYLEKIEAHPQWQGDVALVTHIRLQRVVQDCRLAREQQNGQPCIPFFVKTFQKQLERVRKSIPKVLEGNDRILHHISYVELMIRETTHTAHVRFPPREWGDQDDYPPIGPDAVDCMSHALLAIRSWYTIYDRLTPEEHTGFSIMSWAQMAKALVTLYRLSTHPAPDWDNETVRKTVDGVQVCKRIGAKVGKIMGSVDRAMWDKDFWGRSGSLAVGIQYYMRHGMERYDAAQQSGTPQESAASSAATPSSSAETPTHTEATVAQESPRAHTETPSSPKPPVVNTEGPTTHTETTVTHPETRMTPPKSMMGPPDTAMAPPDTAMAPPDTAMAPPDATMAPPDSMMAHYDPRMPHQDTTMAHQDTPMAYQETMAAPMASAWQQPTVVPHSYPYTMPDGSTGWMSNMGYPSEFVPRSK
ncbi:hypothetical protein BDV19DRAFT_335829 [Aspergillus venezuelensis]